MPVFLSQLPPCNFPLTRLARTVENSCSYALPFLHVSGCNQDLARGSRESSLLRHLSLALLPLRLPHLEHFSNVLHPVLLEWYSFIFLDAAQSISLQSDFFFPYCMRFNEIFRCNSVVMTYAYAVLTSLPPAAISKPALSQPPDRREEWN